MYRRRLAHAKTSADSAWIVALHHVSVAVITRIYTAEAPLRRSAPFAVSSAPTLAGSLLSVAAHGAQRRTRGFEADAPLGHPWDSGAPNLL